MLTSLKEFFTNQVHLQPLNDRQKHMACAALMVEVAAIDEHFDSREFAVLTQHLQQQFNLPADELDELATLAKQERHDSHSLYQFTRLVNDHCSQDDKFELLKGMWKVARADGQIDKYEEYIIRKVSELIHVSHSEFIRAKHRSQA